MAFKRRVIVAIVGQFAQARGNADIEFHVCRMTTGKNKVFESEDAELEEFLADQVKYWNARGWKHEMRGDRNVLTPSQPCQTP
jgi:hypothetical protein